MNNSFKIGITERGDATIHEKEWLKKIDKMNMAILISKDVPTIDSLMRYKNKIILHTTITGYGGTQLEPNVNKPEIIFDKLDYIVNNGFPKNQIVIRIDPIIATDKGIDIAENIINKAIQFKFSRIRFSFLDLYPHVINRFKQANIEIPKQNNNKCLNMINKYDKLITFESCAENTKYAIGCVSSRDLEILGINTSVLSGNKSKQRFSCLCCSEKTEMLNHKNRCNNKCLYCYWYD
jgi:DNA repair photolyase